MSAKAYGLAITLTAAAAVLRYGAGFLDPDVLPFPTFFAATLITAMLAGAAAGLVAAALGFLIAWWSYAAALPFAFTPISVGLYVVVSLIIIWVSGQYRALLRRLQEKELATERQLALVVAENDILASIVADAPLARTLDQLARSIERYTGGEMLASVLLMDSDGRRLRHGAAPSLPDAYNRAIDGAEIGPSVGSCGTAAFRKQPVFVTDIRSDPLWADFRDLANTHGLRACWSIPLLAPSGAVLGTFALYHRQPRAPSQQEKDVVELVSKIATIAIEHDRDRAQHLLLVDELTHRVKNALTVVLSIASSTLKPHAEAASYKAFEQRIMALSKAQGLLTQTQWSDVDVRELVSQIAVAPFAADAARFDLNGPPAKIPARLTLPFAMSLHELSTNAAKYGALTADKGRIAIDWGFRPSGDDKFFLRWSEAGGPPVSAPSRQGFGTRMIKQAFAAEFGGNAAIDFRPGGLVCEIDFPLGLAPEAPHDEATTQPRQSDMPLDAARV